ncbi:MAG: LON peptidase substrate-binding domain-containing protein [Myxococcota bacterium]
MDWKAELFVVPADEVLFPHDVLVTAVSPMVALDLEEAIDAGPVLFLARRAGASRGSGRAGLYRTGTIAQLSTVEAPDGRVYLMARGLARATVEGFAGRLPSLYARVLAPPEAPVFGVDEARVLHELRASVRRIARSDPHLEPELVEELMGITEVWPLVDVVAGHLVPSLEDRQGLLETWNRFRRLELLRAHLRRLELTGALPGGRPPDAYLH